MILLEVQKMPRAIILMATAVILAVSCTPKSNQSQNQKQATEESISSIPPFQTKEPTRYQAQRTITSNTASGESVTNELIAKNGTMRRDEWEIPGVGKIVYLELTSGRFLLLPEAKLYGDLSNDKRDTPLTADESAQLETSADRLLHTDSTSARYQKIGNETLNGRNCVKYRIIVNTEGPSTVSTTETTIWVDESLGMPVKSETTSASGTRITMELSGVSTDVGDELFKIPSGYQRVEPDIIRRRIKAKESQ